MGGMPSIVLKSHIFTAVCNLFLSAAHKADVRGGEETLFFFIVNTPTKGNIDICMRNLFYVIALFFVSISLQAAQLNVASFNIWMSPDGIKNGWQDRKESVAKLVRYHDFDIFGTQEGFFHQLDDIKLGDGIYDYVARGRENGEREGETSAIFYKKDKFELLDSGHFWFSETPEKSSLGWDAMCKRICTWGKFKVKSDGKVFYFFCCHFDHKGDKARNNSAALYVGMIKKIANGATFIGVGDFNLTPDKDPIKLILKDGSILDARKVSETPPYGPRFTWHGNALKPKMSERIDYIFVSPDIKVSSFGVLTDLLLSLIHI